MGLNVVKKVRICEVGLRDGLQNEKTLLTTEQKLDLLQKLTDAGFPVISGQLCSLKEPYPGSQYRRSVPELSKEGVEYQALIANLRGVERAIACGCKKVKLNVSASVAHNLANLNCTPAESVARFAACVERAKEAGIGISGSISMAFGSPWDKEIPVSTVKEIVEAYMGVGITEINTVRFSRHGLPFPGVRYGYGNEEILSGGFWWMHFHNTRGLGMSNILAAMEAGFDQFDSSFAGVGGCPFVPGAAGNVATEDVVHMLDEMKVDTGIDLDKVMAISRDVVKMVGHETDSYLLRAGKASDLILDIPKKQAKNHTLTDKK